MKEETQTETPEIKVIDKTESDVEFVDKSSSKRNVNVNSAKSKVTENKQNTAILAFNVITNTSVVVGSIDKQPISLAMHSKVFKQLFFMGFCTICKYINEFKLI